MPGPIPKRSSERRRANKTPGLTQAPAAGSVRVPPARKGWHPIAAAWYRSLKASGQARYYEPSDWAQAQVLAESLSRMLHADEINAAMLNTILQGSRDLLTTEGQRRRLRLELVREGVAEDDGQADADAAVANVIALALAQA